MAVTTPLTAVAVAALELADEMPEPEADATELAPLPLPPPLPPALLDVEAAEPVLISASMSVTERRLMMLKRVSDLSGLERTSLASAALAPIAELEGPDVGGALVALVDEVEAIVADVEPGM